MSSRGKRTLSGPSWSALKKATDELKDLLASNTELTRQDKELTERVETLTSEIHSRLQAG
jgi:hypothetical protein